MTNFFESRYLTLVGHVQSGKTIEEINYCHESVNHHKRPVVFIVRNITADQLQLKSRFLQYNLDVKLLSNLTIDQTVSFMEICGIVILLCNTFQLSKMKQVIEKFGKPFHVCIDEVDFTIKSRELVSNIDVFLTFIKKTAHHVLGATATPLALFLSDTSLSQIKYLKPNKKYQGIETLNVEFVDSCIIRSEADFPLCDMGAMDLIYETFMKKTHGVILHTVVKEKENHYKIQNYLKVNYKSLTTVVYNGDGIKVICDTRNGPPFATKKELNQYNQLVNKYYQINENGTTFHYFHKYTISEVLSLLAYDPHHTHNFISIIAGHLASRGISFVSTDYRLHLTDQYFYASKNTHGENLLQSLRILGCYEDNVPLTLWCSKKTWDAIISQNQLIHKLVEGVNNSTSWMSKIKTIQINRPKNPLTRPKLCNYLIKPSDDKMFTLDIFYPLDPDLEDFI